MMILRNEVSLAMLNGFKISRLTKHTLKRCLVYVQGGKNLRRPKISLDP